MLKAIQNNPYRFLGVCSNSPAKERIANQRRLKAYLSTGRSVVFPLDLPQLLQSISRTLEDMEKANNAINLPKDQLKHALFWFVNVSPIDKMALEYLQKGDTAKALELFTKKETSSSLINKGVLSFALGNEGDGINCISRVIHTKELRTQFIESICGATITITEEDLSVLFLEQLKAEIPATRLLNLFTQFGVSQKDSDLLKEKAVGEPIAAINSAIAAAKSVPAKDATAQYKAGTKLMNDTKSNLATVKCMVGATDMQYQMVADNLAKQILQCGINYYNNTSEDDDVSLDKAMKLQKYASNISVGKLVKDRCKENVKILEKKIKNLPPKEVKSQVKSINSELARFCKLPDKISYAVSLLNNTKPHLQEMKRILGVGNAYYLNMSTIVVGNALHNIIEEVNAVQNDPMLKIKIEIGLKLEESDLNKIKSALRAAWNATTIMDGFDIESDFKSRYNNNRNALKGLCNQLGISTYSRTSVTPNSGRSTSNVSRPTVQPSNVNKPLTSTTSQEEDTPWGCIIGIVIFIIFCIATCH